VKSKGREEENQKAGEENQKAKGKYQKAKGGGRATFTFSLPIKIHIEMNN
jgi:hypothetical protein